jgi:hypothetical protein
MYDAGKIIFGIIVFILLAVSPFLYNVASGKGSYRPEIKTPAAEKECVAETAYMKAAHMDLIYTWRDQVVRNDKRLYTAFNGKTYNMSLSKTCTSCHSNKGEFCDRCHDYVGVSPYCWDCHVEPKESGQ